MSPLRKYIPQKRTPDPVHPMDLFLNGLLWIEVLTLVILGFRWMTST